MASPMARITHDAPIQAPSLGDDVISLDRLVLSFVRGDGLLGLELNGSAAPAEVSP